MPEGNKTRIREDEKEIEKEADGFENKKETPESKEKKTGEKSFADEEPGDKPQGTNEEAEDLSMIERDLRLPDEVAVCTDSNLQAAKYMVIYL